MLSTGCFKRHECMSWVKNLQPTHLQRPFLGFSFHGQKFFGSFSSPPASFWVIRDFASFEQVGRKMSAGSFSNLISSKMLAGRNFNQGSRQDRDDVEEHFFLASDRSQKLLHFWGLLGSWIRGLTTNKCWPKLVQGLRRDIEINFHINDIYGSVAQRISAWLWIWRTLIHFPVREIFFTLISFNEEMNQKVKNKNNNNSSNYLVFGLWPETKTGS